MTSRTDPEVNLREALVEDRAADGGEEASPVVPHGEVRPRRLYTEQHSWRHGTREDYDRFSVAQRLLLLELRRYTAHSRFNVNKHWLIRVACCLITLSNIEH